MAEQWRKVSSGREHGTSEDEPEARERPPDMIPWLLAHLFEMEFLAKKTRLRTGGAGSIREEREEIEGRIPARDRSRLLSEAFALLDNSERLGLKMSHPESGEYPAVLLGLSAPPFVLWTKGCPEVFDVPAIGMVGAREAGPRALSGFYGLSGGIASLGWTVVSGMARGMDGAAHRGALAGSGRTVAVTGTGLDRVYPPGHADLAAGILSGNGALLSEFPPGAGPEGWHFPHRNRIIVGLSMALVIGAHRRRSGTYVTARIALEEGREVFVFDRGASGWEREGPDLLLGEGARKIETALDIVHALVPQSGQPKVEDRLS